MSLKTTQTLSETEQATLSEYVRVAQRLLFDHNDDQAIRDVAQLTDAYLHGNKDVNVEEIKERLDNCKVICRLNENL